MSATRFSGIAGLVLSLLASAVSAQMHRYSVRVDSTLERLEVSACFDGPAPPSLVADHTGMLYLESMRLVSPQGTLRIDGWMATLTGVPDNACIEYAVKLKPETAGVQKGGPQTRRIGRDLLTSIGWGLLPRS